MHGQSGQTEDGSVDKAAKRQALDRRMNTNVKRTIAEASRDILIGYRAAFAK